MNQKIKSLTSLVTLLTAFSTATLPISCGSTEKGNSAPRKPGILSQSNLDIEPFIADYLKSNFPHKQLKTCYLQASRGSKRIYYVGFQDHVLSDGARIPSYTYLHVLGNEVVTFEANVNNKWLNN